MKPGDLAEVAIWMTGAEPDFQVQHWKTVVCASIALQAEESDGVKFGPWKFVEKRPGEDRVPKVPGHISGPDVRLLVATAEVGPGKPKVMAGTGFVEDLTKEDRDRLRKITRRVHAKSHKGMPALTDAQCDTVIERLGPEAVVATLRKDRGAVH